MTRPELGEPIGAKRPLAAFGMTYAQTLAAVRREIYSSVRKLPDPFALLLSGGLDSSVIAAVGRDLGKTVIPYVFSLRHPIVPQTPRESDLLCARIVADHLGLRCREILLDAADLVRNVPLAVLLAETPRGTIVDPCSGLIEVAKRISRDGFSSVAIGEAADDLFGSFTFALRHTRGHGLRSYYRRELDVGLPDEMAVLQRIFEPWGISLLDPFWTRRFKSIGYNVPLSFRLDSRRLMKKILRDAFVGMLPDEILLRPKVITRDGTQIRYALEKRFGVSRERYRPTFRRIFAEGRAWPKLPPRPKISRR
jgi:asparagine synthase (glutamine-hydrolysing)